jgi:hypothetical protein
VMPTSRTSTEPLLLVFTQDGPGHYDAVISSLETEATTETIKCNCCREPNFEGNACSSKIYKCYRSVIIHAGVKHAQMSLELGHLCLSKESVSLTKNNHLTEDFMSSKFEVINIILKGIVIYLILHEFPIR